MTKPKNIHLKIALVCDWYFPRVGGIESHLRELGKKLCENGHQVHVITPIPDIPSIRDTIPTPCDAKARDFRVIRISTPLFPYFHFMISKNGITKLENILKSEKYDLVHCHFSYVSPFAFGGLYLVKKLRLPGIITFHSFLGKFTWALKMLDNWLGWSKWPVTFSAVSHGVAQDVKKSGVKRTIEVLSNGINPQDWTVSPREHAPHHIQIVSVMRLSKRKRPSHLIKIMDRIRGRINKDTSFKLIIIGDGFEYNKLSRMIKKRGLKNNITLMGVQTTEKIKLIFSKSDIFVLPTILESFGIAALEARCAGLPVVAMEHGGVKSFIRHGKEGFLAKNDHEMADHIIRLINGHDLLTTISKNNINTPCAITWEQVIPEHERLYKKSRDILQP